MLKPISNGPIPPASPVKQLILRLAGELARLHDSQPSALDLIDEARAYLAQPEPEEPTVMEIIDLSSEIEEEGLGRVDLVRRALARWGRPPQ